ncbi:hypothetical protein CQW23_03809 [Capsicum baccatum]|uniref:Xylanase inhibitor N-terminal domain-containing protein n=1 Tax=Capsicum baccatum TaxID=33114 RepID=A0A2G2XCV5_CAPBA|nr:hypothetical protein CQW23_03809 [Capsicum baccatum]
MSRTYQSVKCDKASPCDLKRQQCIYERLYAEISSRFGLLGEDILSFGNLSELGPQRAVFGSEIAETGDIYTQRADGIMGLGRGDVSIVDQLVEKHVISDSFSLCYGGMDFGGGLMILGGINPPAHMVFTKSDFGHRQNSSLPPPSPSTPVVSCLDNRNSTAHMSPSPAPSGPPGYNIPDQITAANVAEECLLASLKADSKAAHIWTSVANAYYLMSDHRSSAKCLEKVGKIEPNCLAVRYAVGVHRIRDAESQ